MQKRSWNELSSCQQVTVATLSAVELVLTTISLIDLVKRPSAQVRGNKLLWAFGVFVQPVGPIAYLTWGRKAGGAEVPGTATA
ncbi:MAG: PLD nuclease N-terminal domain-containing protein [Candidatus Nanopelagicales bacterium]